MVWKVIFGELENVSTTRTRRRNTLPPSLQTRLFIGDPPSFPAPSFSPQKHINVYQESQVLLITITILYTETCLSSTLVSGRLQAPIELVNKLT